jgi:hypothetical protein
MKPAEKIEISCPDAAELNINIDESRIEAMVKFDKEGIFRLELIDKENHIKSISNPIKVSDNIEYNHYWGEFHWHGWDSIDLNELNEDTHPDKAYSYGMDMTRLDFSASGSHGFPQQPEAVGKWWELYRQAAQKYDKPGKYVPFLGFEWTHLEPDGGDRNVIFKQLDVPQPDPSWPIDKLHKYCSDRDILMTPHVGGSVATPIYHSPQSEKFVEMVSGHGNFEWFAQSYLQKGYKTGLAGGSDGHKATPGHPRSVGMEGGRFVFTLRKRDSGFVGGPIFAVQADQLTRNSLWEGFNKKRVYATTGARAIVDFKINDQPMGSELKANSAINIKTTINGTAKIERVDIIRNDKTLKTFYPGILDWTAEFEDLPLKGQNYYYIRILQKDEEMLWSSPIWVESNCTGSNSGLPEWNQQEEVTVNPTKSKEAKKYLPLLMDHLKAEENYKMIKDITPYKVVQSPLANYAVFLCKIREHRVRIHVFYEFELPRFRFEPAWSLYGRERFLRSQWAKPLFETQTNLTRPSD